MTARNGLDGVPERSGGSIDGRHQRDDLHSFREQQPSFGRIHAIFGDVE